MIEKKFYICNHCGNIAAKIKDAGVPLVCCGEPMAELVPNSSGASEEKHMPVVTVDGNTVKVEVGSIAHPMSPEHYIGWVYLLCENGGQRKCLCGKEQASIEFALTEGEKPVAVYAYCNLHGLWKKEL